MQQILSLSMQVQMFSAWVSKLPTMWESAGSWSDLVRLTAVRPLFRAVRARSGLLLFPTHKAPLWKTTAPHKERSLGRNRFPPHAVLAPASRANEGWTNGQAGDADCSSGEVLPHVGAAVLGFSHFSLTPAVTVLPAISSA